MPSQLRVILWVAGFSLWPLLLNAAQVFEVEGVIRGTLLDGRPVIEHEEIPGCMPAMTMAFNVSDLETVADIEIGDRVKFLFHVDGKSSRAESFEVIGKEQSKLVQVIRGGIKPLEIGDKVPSFSLIDEWGDSFSHEKLHGNFTLITFIFTRCPVPEFCPLLATKFLNLQEKLKKGGDGERNVRLLSITLDPEFDSPAILQAYGQRVGADPAIWNFATGNSDEILKLAQAFQVIASGTGATLNHTLTTALIDSEGEVAKLWLGNRWKAEDVMEVISTYSCSSSCCLDTEGK